MQARSHGSAGMWGVGGDKSCEPSQGEGWDAERERKRKAEQGVCVCVFVGSREGEMETGRAASL